MVYKNRSKKLKEIRETAVEETIRIAKILKKSGVDFKKVQYSHVENGKKHFIRLKEIEQEGIDINQIIQANGLNGDFKYGERLNALKKAYKGKGHLAITKVDMEMAKQLGLINEESVISEYLRVAQILQNVGIDISKVQERVKENGKQYYTVLKEIKQEGIDINKIIAENHLEKEYKYGMRLHMLRQAYKGNGTCVITEEEKKLAEKLNLVSGKTNKKKAKSGINEIEMDTREM